MSYHLFRKQYVLNGKTQISTYLFSSFGWLELHRLEINMLSKLHHEKAHRITY